MNRQAPVAIVGAGIAGLTAANALRQAGVPVVVFEAGRDIAGMARSYADADGFSYDFGAHFITNRLAAAIGVGSRCRDVHYYGESVLLRDRVYSYPFGLMRVGRYLMDGVATKITPRGGPANSAADAFRHAYGRALADEVALPLLEAWSGEPANRLAASTLAKLKNSIPYTLYLKLASRLKAKAIAIGYSHEMPESAAIWHVYPEGGVATLCDKLSEPVRDAIEMESPVERIHVDAGRVVSIRAKGRDRDVSAVVSTAPVPILAKLVSGTDALEPLRRFRYRPMIFVNLRLNTRGVLPDTILWTPESDFPFFRMAETTLSMPWLAPEGKTIITADIGCQVGDAHWVMSDDALGKLCLAGLEKYRPGIRSHYLGCRVLRTPIAYPVLLNEYEQDRQNLERGTGVKGLYSIGRNGEFAHILMEDIYWRTRRKMHDLTQLLKAS